MSMEIRPAKKYKKPLYALGVATAIMASSLTGCADFLSGRRKPDVVNYGSETTVVISKETIKNSEYNIKPFRIRNKSLYREPGVTVYQGELSTFAESKLETITYSNNKFIVGLYQGYEFTIIGVDKFLDWMNYMEYGDSYSDQGGLCLRYRESAARIVLIDFYKDPSEKFIVVTECNDNKVIYEFFHYGKKIPKDADAQGTA